MCRKILNSLTLILVFSLLVSCNEDGENPYVLWQKYTHPDGAFSFYYMAPPFNIAKSEPEHPHLLVEPYDTPTPYGLKARIYVEAWQCDQYYIDELQDRIDKWNNDRYFVGPYREYANYFGDVGAMLEMEVQDHWVKEIYYPFQGGCVAISVNTNERGSRDDIEFLLAGFRPGGAIQ